MTGIPWHPLGRVAAVLATLLAQSLALGAGPADAAVQYYEIRSPVGMCLSVAGSSLRDGADVVQWNCLGITDQRWRVTNGLDQPVGDLEDRPVGKRADHILFVKLRAQHSDKCLALAGDRFELDTDVVQADCADPEASTEWMLNGSGDLFLIASEHCAGVANGSRHNGAPVVQQDCDRNPQKWRFTPWE
ncbi:RICIN domain-containing protein [Streptomyces sp. NBC_00161]|uniref:RICIN domain-containing protein n=1 Tax=Streptomyces sp. NBC_00161 TaxID=2975671 RepID=UPI00324A6E4A